MLGAAAVAAVAVPQVLIGEMVVVVVVAHALLAYLE
jgi:hypothetical protein